MSRAAGLVAVLALAAILAAGIGPARGAVAADVATPPPAAECRTLAEGQADAEMFAATAGVPVGIILVTAEGSADALLILVSPAMPTRLVFRYRGGCLVEAWEAPG